MSDAPAPHPLLAPRSIALVGATEAEHKLAGRRWRSLVDGGYAGRLYPVHPTATTVRGIPARASLAEVPEPVDLVVIAVPAQAVPEVALQCAGNGARAAVILSGGFAESGEAGRRLEDLTAAILAEAGIPMIGPNCAGMVSTPARVNLMGWHAPPGPVGVISQSGNIALDLGYQARLHGGGFSRIVSMGNARSTGVVPLLRLLLDDPETRAVIVYIEGWREGEGRAFVDAVRAAPGGKPIVLMNPGRTPPGRRAAVSHTGALAAPARVVDGVARSLGVLRTEDPETAWHTACQLARGRRVDPATALLLTDGGGHATLVSDALGAAGLALATPGDDLRATLASRLPPICSIGNPLDFAGVAEGEPEAVARTLETCLTAREAGAVIVAGHFGGYHRVGGEALREREIAAATAMAASATSHAAAVLVHSVHGNEALDTLAPLRDAGVPVTASASCLGRVAGLLHEARGHAPREPHGAAPEAFPRKRVESILSRAVVAEARWLMEPESRALLAALGIATPEHRTAETARDARDAALELLASAPAGIAMKRIKADAPHKSDAGGVCLGIRNEAQVDDAIARLLEAGSDARRILVTPMLDGVELAVGGVNDTQFGPCVMLGAGGTALELLDDVVFRPAPLSTHDAASMLASLRIAPLLAGHRGREAANRDALFTLLVQVGNAMLRCPWIAALDLNPVLVSREGARPADARVVLRD